MTPEEAVVLGDPNVDKEDLQKIVVALQEELGMKTLSKSIHKRRAAYSASTASPQDTVVHTFSPLRKSILNKKK